MASGRLGKAILTAATNTTLYTAPANVRWVDVDINVLNSDASASATIEIAIATAATPATNEYIEKGVILVAGGVLERSSIRVGPSELVVVKSSASNTVVRVSGTEQV